jgi:hypothetical protein
MQVSPRPEASREATRAERAIRSLLTMEEFGR